MSLDENKAVVRRYIEAYNQQNLDVLDGLFAPDYVDHILQIQGLESLKQNWSSLYKGFPDIHSTIEDIIAEGDKVCLRYTNTGTHTGEYQGLAPTAKKMTFACIDTFKIVDGKIAEAWHVYDFLDFYRQLGVIEYKGFPDEKVS